MLDMMYILEKETQPLVHVCISNCQYELESMKEVM
jgi:hypothetical protein